MKLCKSKLSEAETKEGIWMVGTWKVLKIR